MNYRNGARDLIVVLSRLLVTAGRATTEPTATVSDNKPMRYGWRRSTSTAISRTGTLPDYDAILEDRPYAVQRNLAEHTVLILHRKHSWALRIEADGCERDDLFLLSDPIVVAEGERALPVLGVPADAREQVLQRLQ